MESKRVNATFFKLALRVLRLYPRNWREHYREEMEEILEQHIVTSWTLLDLLIGAIDAHLHTELLPGRLTSMAYRIRTSEIVIFCAYVLFAVSWLMLRSVRDPIPEWESVVLLHPELRLVLSIVDTVSLVGFVAVVLGGLPILLAAIRRSVSARRKDLLVLFGSPVLLVAAFFVATTVVIGNELGRGGTPLDAAVQLGYVGLGFLCLAGSVGAVAAGVSRSEIDERAVRFALIPFVICVVAMGVGLAGTLLLAALLSSEAPQLLASWLRTIIVLMMGVAVGLSVVAAKRGLVRRNA